MPGPDDVRWLSADEQRAWRAWLEGVAVLNQNLDAALRPYGLDLGEYEILVVLSESPEHALRMSDLALAVHQSRSRLTHTVTRMEAKCLLSRSPSSQDRRGVVATLTDEGMALLERTAPAHVRSVRRYFVDAVAPHDFEAIGRAMAAVVAGGRLAS